MLEMKGPLPDMTVQSFVSVSGESFTVENISTDSAFSFIILVSNIVGVVSTERRTFCEHFFYLTIKFSRSCTINSTAKFNY